MRLSKEPLFVVSPALRAWTAGLAAVGATMLPPSASAQTNLDSLSFRLEEIVVIAEGVATTLRESVAAASVLTRNDLRAIPARSVADLLRTIPGLVFLDQDGSGGIPLSIARGFYGGGETEYMLVTMDGVPLNDLRTGAVDWTRVRPLDVERIEVLRGGGAAIYGDQAVGAVVNIVSRPRKSSPHWSATTVGGAWGDLEQGVMVARTLARGNAMASVDFARSSGYRGHSASELRSADASWATASDVWSMNARYSTHFNEDPGPLMTGALAEDRRQGNPAFGADETTRRAFDAGLLFRSANEQPEAATGSWIAELGIQTVDQDRTRTILLTPAFGNTQRHAESSVMVRGKALYDRSLGPVTVTAGVEAIGGSYDSRYFDLEGGTGLSAGDGTRAQGAVMGSADWRPSDRVKLVAGARFDAIGVEGKAGDASFDRFSPRIGLNIGYSLDPSHVGHVYASWGKAFKTPTLDQLYDAREIPVGAGATVNLSNPALKPQSSSDLEFGFYQAFPGPAGLRGDVSVAVYRIELEDEIDFDLNTFRYGNIQQSLHTGLETSLNVPLTTWFSVSETLTLGKAEFGLGEFDGNQLKNIPRAVTITSARALLTRSLGLTASWRHIGGMYLDDANTEAVAPRDVWDLAGDWQVGDVTVFATIRNALDSKGEEGGYMLFDPATQTSVRLLYPSGGRYARIGVRLTGGR